MSTSRSLAHRLKVGEWVVLQYGLRRVWAQIIEDRGPLGVGGQRIYRLRFGQDEEMIAFEASEDNLEPAPKPDQSAVADYFKRGGLVAILQSNLSGGRNQPHVWLTFDSDGTITHTFDQDLGLIGGETVPFFALLEYSVFKPKSREVIDFLRGFGLDQAQAEEVVDAVGTAP